MAAHLQMTDSRSSYKADLQIWLEMRNESAFRETATERSMKLTPFHIEPGYSPDGSYHSGLMLPISHSPLGRHSPEPGGVKLGWVKRIRKNRNSMLGSLNTSAVQMKW